MLAHYLHILKPKGPKVFLVCLPCVIILGLLLLTGILRFKPAPEIRRPYGGTLRLGGLGGTPSIINPILTDRTVSKALIPLIFNSLIRLNKELLPEPDLAESWDISADGLTYTFHLRKGVRFHDGIECTAEDVRFTYELITDLETNSPWRDYFTAVEKWEATDRYTLRIRVRKPFALLLSRLTEHIAPRHLLAGKDLRTTSFNRHPMGTGPFRFKEWTGDNQVILEANLDYYEGRPYLDRVIARGYETTVQYWAAFMRGEIDVIFFLSREDFETAQRDPAFRTYAFPSPFTHGLEYNLDHPFFQDQRVRQALAYGINIPAMINKVEGGYGMPSTGPFLPGSWPCNPVIKPSGYDPALSLKLLREAGWSLNKNNILEKDGQEFRFTMLVNSELRNGQMMAMLIYQDLYRLGMRIDIKPFGYKRREEEGYQSLARGAGAYLTSFCIRPDPAELVHDWHSGFTQRQSKLYGYRNPEVEGLFAQGERLTRITDRQKVYQRIHELIHHDQPATFLYFPYHLGAIDRRFQDTDSVFSPSMPFDTVKGWYIR